MNKLQTVDLTRNKVVFSISTQPTDTSLYWEHCLDNKPMVNSVYRYSCSFAISVFTCESIYIYLTLIVDTSPRKNRVTDDPDMKLLDEKDSKHLDQSILKVVLHFIHKLLDKSYRLWNGNLFFTPLPPPLQMSPNWSANTLAGIHDSARTNKA